MKKRHQHTLVLGLIASLCSPLVHAQDAATKALIEQGQYWQSRGDSQRAIETWQRLLRSEPNQPDALYGMARAQIQANNRAEAERYLNQLRSAHPQHRLVARLQQDLATQGNAAQLQQARTQAQAGQTEQAVSSYQAALGGAAPTGPLALEYYQTLGGTSAGWEEARKGLERLAREAPDDAKISLALAQHLTYRESTRREGISQLSRLAGNATVGKSAIESWRKALAWMGGGRAADIPMYQAYLRVNPDDQAMQARLREIESRQRATQVAAAAARDPLRLRSVEGFKALDDGDLEAAEADFRSVLEARANDGDALGGMGLVRLRQEEFVQARDYLERASRQGAAGRWKQALSSATYWSLVQQAGDAQKAGDLPSARQMLEQAIKIDAKEITAESTLADVLSEQGQLDAAEAAYRRVLARQQDNPDAIRGLASVLAQTGKAGDALKLVEKLTPEQQEKVGSLGRLRATQAMGQAREAMERGDDNAARVALEDALLSDPGNAWVRLDLARLYLRLGATREARGVMDGLLVSNPNMPEALYASALLASESGDWAGAMETLDRIPEKNRTRDIATLQRRVWVHVQADTAARLGKQGHTQKAMTVLSQTEPFVGQDAELLGTVALAYADAGDPNRALGMVRQMLARMPQPSTGLRLQYAAALLKTQQDVELAGVLRQLQEVPMSAQERRSFDDLRAGYILRQADALRQSGDLASAYDMLAPLLAERPNDPDVIGVLARLYTDHGDGVKALSLYHGLLERDPRNLKLIVPAIAAATAAKDYNYAESALATALQLTKNDPEVLTAAGRLYRAKGQTSKASEYFAAAVRAEQGRPSAWMGGAAGAGAAPGAPGAPGGNPFRPAGSQAAGGWNAGSSGMVFPAAAARTTALPGQYNAMPAAAGQYPAQYPYAGGPQPFIPNPAGVAYMPNPTMVAQGPATPATYYDSGLPANTTAGRPITPAPVTSTSRVVTPRSASAPASTRRTGAMPGSDAALPAATPVAQAGAASGYMAPISAAQPQGYVPAPAGYAGYPGYAAQPAYAAPATVGTHPNAWATASNVPTPGADQRPRTALDELSELQQQRAATISVGVIGRVRQGESGMSKMGDIQAPVEVRFPAGDGTMSVRVTPTGVSAGTPDLSYGTLSRFGSGPVTALDMPTRSPGSQNDSGVGIGVGYETANFAADIGTLPLGFNQTDFMGGVKYRLGIGERASVTGELSRRPVTDSVLSFSGARDARTGEKWGGVSATGGKLGLGWEDGDFGVYASGSAHALQGHNVKSNYKVEVGGGMYWHVYRNNDSQFTAGMNVTGLSYNRNLRYFTYGHGGYFSPQQFLSASVPFDWTQRSGRLSYQVNGALGVQYFKEDSAAYFPNSTARQSAAAQAASDAEAFGSGGGSANAIYPGQSKTGVGYRLGMAMEYQMHPQLFVGGQLSLDNARDYRQFSGGIYVRYALQPYNGKASLPVSPLKSPYQF